MKALRFYGRKDLRFDDVQPPTCGTDEVRIRVAYCGICGTDMHEYLDGPILLPQKDTPNTHSGATLPLIMGHEMSGTIIEAGKDVPVLKAGQRVAVNPCMGCRHHGGPSCELCQQDCPNICIRSTFYGLSAQTGGFASEIVVKHHAAVPIPDKVSLKAAALAEPLAVAAHMVRISGIRTGQDALVLGAGPIGCALIIFLRSQGIARIIVSEVAESRVLQAKQCGADLVVDPTSTDTLEAVHEMVGKAGVDVAFDACGLQITLDTAFASTKPGGTIFNVAIHDTTKSINLNLLTLSERRLLAGNAYTIEDFRNVIRLLETNSEQIEQLITAIVPLEKAINEGFEELVSNRALHNKILVAANDENMTVPS